MEKKGCIGYIECIKTSVFTNQRANWKKKKCLPNDCLINNIKYKVCRLFFLVNFFTTHRKIGTNAWHNILKVLYKIDRVAILTLLIWFIFKQVHHICGQKQNIDNEKNQHPGINNAINLVF